MLYHIPDRVKAISEINRVLKDDGIFYASTMRSSYMKEMRDLIIKFKSLNAETGKLNGIINNFSIETGKEQLEKNFNNVELKIYKNSLIIDDAESLADYAYSLTGMNRRGEILNESDRNKFTDYLINIIKSDGSINIPADSGLFICRNNIQ
jgi:SAM-dependent methyltransferase